MFLTLIKNSILRNKTQKMLTFLACFLTTVLICSMLNLTLGVGNEVGKQLRSYGSNIVVLPKGSSLSIEVGNQIYEPLKNKSYLDESNLHKIKEIFWRNNITAFAPFLEGEISFSSNENKEAKKGIILGTYFDKKIDVADEDDFHTGIKSLYPLLSVDGAWASDDSVDEIMLGDTFAKENQLKIGDSLIINDKSLKIVGIISHFSKNENKIITSLKLAQEILNKPGLFSKAEVSALTIPENDLAQKARRDLSSLNQIEYDKWYCTAYVSSIAYQIEEDFKGASAKAQTSISEAEGLIINKVQSLMGATAVICLIVASVAISSLMSSEVHRRAKEIGLLKVLGATTAQIYLIFVCENLLVALFAAFLGWLLGLGLCELIAYQIFNHSIELSFISLPLCLVFALLAVLLGCLFALRGVAALTPAEVLYGK